jgi:hypothetical protein
MQHVPIGDCDLALPLRQQVKSHFGAGITMRRVPGNHVSNSPEWHGRRWSNYPDRNLPDRWRQVGRFVVAGLSLYYFQNDLISSF